jgi:hypothetical protein
MRVFAGRTVAEGTQQHQPPEARRNLRQNLPSDIRGRPSE